nr:AlNc14C881G12597 [Albugo laibachii Nc14]|eukprot:CCA27956.1 AlNc14C881G12597 [Albugo laibachii Nc14]
MWTAPKTDKKQFLRSCHDQSRGGPLEDRGITYLLRVKQLGIGHPAQSLLLVRDGVIGDKSVKILMDSGASTNLIKPDLASAVLSAQKVQARRFDGTWTSSQRRYGVPKDAVHGKGPPE